MKQIRDSTDCVPVVAAMATKTSIEAFKKKVGKELKEGGYEDYDLWKYLWDFKMVCGIPLQCSKYVRKVISLSALQKTGIMQFPAFLTVASEVDEGELHALYWDGKKIHDPNPDVKDGRHPSEYDIYYWCPITKCK